MQFFKKKRFHFRETCIFTDETTLVECTLWEKIKDIYHNTVYRAYMRYIYWPYSNNVSGFFRRIKTVRAYLPILWNDFDFDHSYILRLLEKKLERMIPIFEDGHLMNCERRAKELKIALALVKRLLEDDYLHQASEEIERRLGKTQRRVTKVSIGTQVEFWNGDEEEAKAKEQQHTRIRRSIYKKWDNKKKADTQYLFHLMGRKLHDWWD